MDTAQFLKDLRSERDRIDNAIAALEALDGTVTSSNGTAVKPAAVKVAKTTASPSSKTRTVSPEARQRMAEAQQKRWAKKKRAVKAAAKKAAAVAPTTVKPAKAAPFAAPAAKGARKPMSPATKKKLALAAKARWAAKKAHVAKMA
jgi:hypothetical protein